MAVNMATGESAIVCPAIFTEKVEALLRESGTVSG
jgi:hypothetical protein